MPADLVHASQEGHEFEARRHRLEGGRLFCGVGRRMKRVGINHSNCSSNFYGENQVVFYTPDDCVDGQTQWVARKTDPLDYGGCEGPRMLLAWYSPGWKTSEAGNTGLSPRAET